MFPFPARFSPAVLAILAASALSGCGFDPGRPAPSPLSPPSSAPPAPAAPDRVIDHRCVDLGSVPASWIASARDSLHILYGHSSHGRQLVAGMEGLDAFMGGTGLYAVSYDGAEGALDLQDERSLRDSEDREAVDLGNPDGSAWAAATRIYLDAHPEVNAVIWSWCGEVSYASPEDIDAYLYLMEALEADYPAVAFVYMTGHLDGSGPSGSLMARNARIREYCRDRGKWLFDFQDIECYDPDGAFYGDRLLSDAGNWDADGSGTVDELPEGALGYAELDPSSGDRNWALEWMDAHPGAWYPCSGRWGNTYHAPPLIANLKGRAAWWLWARISGWEG